MFIYICCNDYSKINSLESVCEWKIGLSNLKPFYNFEEFTYGSNMMMLCMNQIVLSLTHVWLFSYSVIVIVFLIEEKKAYDICQIDS